MGKQEDIAAARGLVRTLDKAIAALTRHYPDGVDVRRLRDDAGRLDTDLDLLCGATAPASPAPRAPTAPKAPPSVREVIADSAYARDFWMDAEDEGLGQSDTRRR